jgi:hypothetical protein
MLGILPAPPERLELQEEQPFSDESTSFLIGRVVATPQGE